MMLDEGAPFSRMGDINAKTISPAAGRPTLPSPCDWCAVARARDGTRSDCPPIINDGGVFTYSAEQRALTSREQDVLAQIVAGASNKEAAIRLGISPRTVENHRGRIMQKLGARNTADVVRIALTEGPRLAATA